MRTLELNKIDLWASTPTGYTDKKDSAGNYTGERVKTFPTATKVRVHAYPKTSRITEEIFGIDSEVELAIITDKNIVFTDETLLFKTAPTVAVSKYNNNYDYKIIKILESINSNQYGVRSK